MRNFVRKIENFVCENCGEKVVGDGYTDHCPKCLQGKHVDDKIPGDRASKCGGRLEPVGAEYKQGKFKIRYKCQKCGYIFCVRAAYAMATAGRRISVEDDREKLVELCGT